MKKGDWKNEREGKRQRERNLNYKSEIFPSYHYGKKLFANFSPIKTSEDGSIEVDGKKTRNLTKAFWIVSLQAFDRERSTYFNAGGV